MTRARCSWSTASSPPSVRPDEVAQAPGRRRRAGDRRVDARRDPRAPQRPPALGVAAGHGGVDGAVGVAREPRRPRPPRAHARDRRGRVVHGVHRGRARRHDVGARHVAVHGGLGARPPTTSASGPRSRRTAPTRLRLLRVDRVEPPPAREPPRRGRRAGAHVGRARAPLLLLARDVPGRRGAGRRVRHRHPHPLVGVDLGGRRSACASSAAGRSRRCTNAASSARAPSSPTRLARRPRGRAAGADRHGDDALPVLEHEAVVGRRPASATTAHAGVGVVRSAPTARRRTTTSTCSRR